MKLYWVSAIIHEQADKKPRLWAINDGQLSLERAMELIYIIKANYTVLSVWVDTFNEDDSKQTVFHECYINAFGDIGI